VGHTLVSSLWTGCRSVVYCLTMMLPPWVLSLCMHGYNVACKFSIVCCAISNSSGTVSSLIFHSNSAIFLGQFMCTLLLEVFTADVVTSVQTGEILQAAEHCHVARRLGNVLCLPEEDDFNSSSSKI
jgi:hypothetical protein